MVGFEARTMLPEGLAKLVRWHQDLIANTAEVSGAVVTPTAATPTSAATPAPSVSGAQNGAPR